MTRLRIILAMVVAIAIVAGVVLIRRGGEAAGAAKVTASAEKTHTAAVTAARSDERAAATVAQSIAARTVRIDAQTDAYVQSTIKDLRDALSDVPPAAADAALPAAPVERLRDSLNASIDRANRAGDAASAAP
jgi:Flp pilus assembly protein CpaB